MPTAADSRIARCDEDAFCAGGNGEASGNLAANVDLARIERAVREILAAVGEDPDREGLLETPARVARMLPPAV
jgi:GTP cyclohydrolase I